MRTIHRTIAYRARIPRGTRVIVAAILAAMVSLSDDPRALAQEADDEATKAQVKELFARGREATRNGDELLAKGQRDQAMEAYGAAVASFLEAYGVAQSPLLLYSLGQVYRSRGENHWALACYKQFLADAAVLKSTSEVGQAAHRFVPDATQRAAELETAVAGQQAPAASDSPLDPAGVCYPRPAEPAPVAPEPVEPEPVDPEPEPLPPIVDPGPGSGRTGYRIGFWASGGVAAASFVGAAVTFFQVRSLEDEKTDAIQAYQTATNDQLAIADACGDASAKQGNLSGMDRALIDAVVSACDRGRSRATLSNVLQGVALVSAAAAGYFLYKGYLQKNGTRQEARTVRIEPVLSPESVGAQMMLRF